MTVHEGRNKIIYSILDLYDDREAANIAELVMEHLTGWPRIERIMSKHTPLSITQVAILEEYIKRLQKFEPVQYILEETWFSGMKFFTNHNVLIPRPETEELTEWMINDLKNSEKKLRILDIGTGSGCIAVTLKKKLPGSDVMACDISEEALTVAGKNAEMNNTNIEFLKLNILDNKQWYKLPAPNVLVSNPPYIPLSDKEAMRKNVTDYEPHLALFVNDNDPLIFYRAIANAAQLWLKNDLKIYAEVHENLAQSVVKLFEQAGLKNIVIKKDLQGKDRMIRASV